MQGQNNGVNRLSHWSSAELWAYTFSRASINAPEGVNQFAGGGHSLAGG
jgi:hypothetical protein